MKKEDKVQLFGNLKLTDSQYFNREPTNVKSSYLFESLTNIVKEIGNKKGVKTEIDNQLVQSIHEIKVIKDEKMILEEKMKELQNEIENLNSKFSQTQIQLTTENSQLKETLSIKEKRIGRN